MHNHLPSIACFTLHVYLIVSLLLYNLLLILLFSCTFTFFVIRSERRTNMIIKRSLVFSVLLVLLAALAFASYVALAETDFDNTRDPDHKYKECLERCERHEGRSFQERCRDDCQVRRKQTEERREQERGGDRGRHEEQKRREEERARKEEEERRREQEKGSGGRGREEQQREEERSREHEKGSGGRGREEQERRREHEKGTGSRGREEQRGQEERAREEEERARKEEEQQEEEWREQQKGGRGGGRREKQRREKEGDNFIREVTSRDPEYSREGKQQKEQEGESGQEGEKNPFVFKDRHFRTIVQTQHGRERVLPKFTERSKLFKGIQNYRLLIAEAEPQAFFIPRHYDADILFFVAQGKGTVSIVRQNKRETFNIKRGDVGVIPSGTTVYLINPSSNEKLVLAKLLHPVNTPGRFENFFGAGGEEPESFYRAFSTEILEAAFNTRRDKFEGIFRQQRQGEIVKASEEQIKRLSQHEEEGGFWPFGGESKSNIVNIFKQQPIQSNQYGKLYQVDGSKIRQFQDLDVAVSVANISQGSMSTVLYNSRATKIAIVSNGEGYFEMACPHLSQSPEGRQQQEQQGRRRGSSPSYQKVSARLRPGVAVVIPAGHPHVIVASENQNLEIVSFAINANNNERFPLAGRANVINQFERTAKELAFGVPAREVEEVFRNQEEDFFFKGPNQKQRRGQGA